MREVLVGQVAVSLREGGSWRAASTERSVNAVKSGQAHAAAVGRLGQTAAFVF